MSTVTQVEKLLPSLFNVAGPPRAVEVARKAADYLLHLVDILASEPEDDNVERFRAALQDDKSLTPATKQVAQIVFDHFDPVIGGSRISTSQIARLAGRGSHAPVRAMRSLSQLGWFTVQRSPAKEERRGAANLYIPNFEMTAQVS